MLEEVCSRYGGDLERLLRELPAHANEEGVLQRSLPRTVQEIMPGLAEHSARKIAAAWELVRSGRST